MQDIFKLVDCVVEQEFTKERARGSGRRRFDHGPCIVIDDDDDGDAVGGSKEGPPPSSASGESGVQNGEPRSHQPAAVGRDELPVTTGNGSSSVSNGGQILGPPPPLIRTQSNGYFTSGERLRNGSKALEPPPPPLVNGTKQAKGHSYLSGGRCAFGEGVCNGNGSVGFGLEDALWGSEETTLWPPRHATAGLAPDYRRNCISSRTPANGTTREWRRSFLLDALALKLRNKQCRIYQLFVFKIFFHPD